MKKNKVLQEETDTMFYNTWGLIKVELHASITYLYFVSLFLYCHYCVFHIFII